MGTRPQIIKSASIVNAVQRKPGIDLLIVHTGQHYDYEMSKAFFDEMKLPSPDVNLNVGSGTHGWQTAEIMKRLERVIQSMDPRCVLFPGDTNSALAAAVVAAKLGVPAAHLEAGARSYDMTMPEEINRVLADHSSSLLFAPTGNCWHNLRREGIPRARILLTGDTHYDAFVGQAAKILDDRVLKKFQVEGRFVYVTVHRPENVDNPNALRLIVNALLKLRDFQVVFSVHPRTKSMLRRIGMLRRLRVSRKVAMWSPVTYLQSLSLAWRSSVVITDSGGLQREAFWLGTPCVVLRRTTEWPETLRMRSTLLAPPATTNLVSKVQEASRLGSVTKRKVLPVASPSLGFGDGQASDKVLAALRQRYM